MRVSKQALHIVEVAAQPDPATVLPVVLQLDDADSPIDILDALLITRFGTGAHAAARTAQVKRLRKDAPLLPAGATVIRTATEDSRSAVLATGDGWMLQASRWKRAAAKVTVTAITDEARRRGAGRGGPRRGGAARPRTRASSRWASGTSRSTARAGGRGEIAAADVGRDPVATTRRRSPAPLDRLMGSRPDSLAGRLLLLHGAAGHRQDHGAAGAGPVVARLVPGRLRARPGAAVRRPRLPDGRRARRRTTTTDEERWRLLLLEDCDELIRGEAKQSTGQALSRLLNLTDGLLGQGRRRPGRHHHQRGPGTAAPGGGPPRPVPGADRGRAAADGRGRGLAGHARTGSDRTAPRSPSCTRCATTWHPWSPTHRTPQWACTSDAPRECRILGGREAAKPPRIRNSARISYVPQASNS